MAGRSQRWSRIAGLAVALYAAACSGGDNDVVGPTVGQLTVTIGGLPAGTNASVQVSSTSGFNRSVTSTETLAGLAPGSYTVVAASVTASDGRYVPAPASQTVTVIAGTTPAAATVAYALASGSLTITVAGLPTGTNATVTVTGPNAFQRTVTATTTLSALEPGSYAVAAADVVTATDRFAPAAASQTITVAAGSTSAAVSVAYVLASGRLTVNVSGVPAGSVARASEPVAGANAAVTVSGPNGFLSTVTATTTLTQLVPGSYTVSASDVVTGGFTYRPTPASQAVTVGASTTPATASVSYSVIDGALTVTVTGLPQGANAAINVTGPAGFTRALTATATITTLAPGIYTVQASNVSSGATTFTPAPTSQNVTVVAGVTASATLGYSAPIRLTQVVTGLNRPVQLVAPASDPRLFVVEQEGRIRIIQNGQLVAQPFLDVAARILPVSAADDEHGLLGLAFHPQYGSNGFFFVFYMDLSQDLVIERYQVSANPNVANTAGTLVLKVPHRTYTSHNGGGLAFGPDGFLYISLGDGGCCVDPQQNGQNLNSLLGKVLRLDVTTMPYVIPPTNPFAGQAGRRGEIWAYGLRNPWRIDIDATTSVLYIADVGEDDVEEVDAVPLSVAGPNFGWSIMEGTRCVQAPCSSQGLRLPTVEYSHGEGCSITGGYVYRGTQIPELQGHYFYSDYCSGFLRSFLFVNGAATQQRDWNITPPGSVTSFGKDGNGELYILTQEGAVFRIVRQ